MKKKSLLCAMVLTSLCSFAQPDNYVFTVAKNVPYQNLFSPSIVTTQNWDDFNATIPLDFTFQFMGDTTSNLYFDTLYYNVGTDMQFHSISTSSTPFNMISWYYDLEDRHKNNSSQTSTIGYKTDIINSKKITKIEWNNVGFYDDTLHIDSANVQLWLYEANNAVEFRFGNNSKADITRLITDPTIFGAKGPLFMFFKQINLSNFTGTVYTPSYINPPTMDSNEVLTLFSNPSNMGIDSFPDPNTLFRWAPAVSSGVNSVSLNDNISVYPTLFNTDFSINFKTKKDCQLSIYEMNGNLLMTKKLNHTTENIDMKQYVSGNYILKLNNLDETIIYQITKQ